MKVKTTTPKVHSDVINPNTANTLVNDISRLINDARNHIAREYNATQALLCWLIGKRIDEEILKAERAEYGEAIVIRSPLYCMAKATAAPISLE